MYKKVPSSATSQRTLPEGVLHVVEDGTDILSLPSSDAELLQYCCPRLLGIEKAIQVVRNECWW